jgi:predicted Ser/Thr protein kinase
VAGDDFALGEYRRILGHSYRFEAFLGRGGSASVYRVTNLRLNRPEALKILHDRRGDDFIPRFEQEARVSAQLQHSNIVTVHAYGHDDGVCWYAMQLVDGPSLRRQVRLGGPVDAAQAAFIGERIAGALEYSHRRGVVHRDVKPANIILDRTGEPVLTDFGIAKSRESLVKTQTGLVLGTPAFISPEQAAGRETDGRTDIYSLGISLYQALTERYPFDSDNDLQQVILRMSEDPIDIREHLPELDRRVAEVVMKSIRRDAAARYASAGQMQVAFAEAGSACRASTMAQVLVDVNAEPVVVLEEEARPDTTTTRVSRRRSRRGVWPAVGLLGAGLALTIAAMGWRGLGSDPGSGGGSTPDQPRPEVTTEIIGNPAVDDQAVGTASIDATPVVPPSTTATPVPSTPIPTPPPTALPRRAVEPPQILHRAPPELSADQALRCAGQQVVVSVLVSEAGDVTRVRILSGDDPVCTEAARRAAERFRFGSGLDAAGQPVEAWATLGIEFEGEKP